MKIVFMGTPDFAVPSLKRLIEEYGVEAVFTQPDKPKGRGKKMAFSPVKEVAVEHDIKVFQPLKLKEDREAIEYLKDLKPDFIIVVAYGQILTKEVLDIPVYGCINLHASLLPMDRGANLLVDTINGLKAGTITPIKQEGETCYAKMLNKEIAKIDWNCSSREVHNLIRGLNPWPIAHTSYQGQTMKIYESSYLNENSNKEAGTILSVDKTGMKVSCGSGILLVKKVQFPNGKPLTIEQYINGNSIEEGIKLI